MNIEGWDEVAQPKLSALEILCLWNAQSHFPARGVQREVDLYWLETQGCFILDRLMKAQTRNKRLVSQMFSFNYWMQDLAFQGNF